jgi:hypothetical protein
MTPLSFVETVAVQLRFSDLLADFFEAGVLWSSQPGSTLFHKQSRE